MAPNARSALKRRASEEPEVEQQHLLITRKEKRNSATGVWNLVPGRHEAMEIVHWARNIFDLPGNLILMDGAAFPARTLVVSTSERQSEIVSIFTANLAKRPFRKAEGSAQATDNFVLKSFALFDEYFFAKQIGKYTKVKLADDLVVRHRALGLSSSAEAEGPYRRLIELDRQGIGACKTELEKIVILTRILGVLLHEMVHCLFLVYACRCGLAECKRLRRFMIADYGHGFCWKELTDAVQRVGRAEFDPTLDLQCGNDGVSVRGFFANLRLSMADGSIL
ncbi:hypothetical protein MMC16_000836 [Acarospora aff. strigata]|nr:hypothetical protein [Acarospora aff. strigata]